MRVAFGVIVLAFVGGVIGLANGADSAQQSAFSDAKTVDAAAKDVMNMPKGEIGEFIEYLSHCADAPTEFGKYECGVSRNRFRIRFASNRAIDRWVEAREETAKKTSDYAKAIAAIEEAARRRAQELIR